METREERNKIIRSEIKKEEREKATKIIVKVTTIILSFILIVLCYGMFIGAKVINVKEYKITSSKIPSSYHGIKVVQLSDLLLNSLTKNDLTNLKKEINSLKPDILVFTGNLKRNDYSLDKEDINNLEDFFQGLTSTIARFSVMGSNDDDTFQVIMENSNFEILNNDEKILYYKDNEPIKFIGYNTNDIKEITNDDNYYTICILSNPDKFENSNCDLALASDTLGGEIKIPIFNTQIFNNHKYNKDYYKINNTDLYISNGIGNNNNIRLFNHPSITLFRLTTY